MATKFLTLQNKWILLIHKERFLQPVQTHRLKKYQCKYVLCFLKINSALQGLTPRLNHTFSAIWKHADISPDMHRASGGFRPVWFRPVWIPFSCNKGQGHRCCLHMRYIHPKRTECILETKPHLRLFKTHHCWTKWPSFRKRYFQMHFRKLKCFVFWLKISLKFVPKSPTDNNPALV